MIECPAQLSDTEQDLAWSDVGYKYPDEEPLKELGAWFSLTRSVTLKMLWTLLV